MSRIIHTNCFDARHFVSHVFMILLVNVVFSGVVVSSLCAPTWLVW